MPASRLPPGRHGLSREQVANSQRNRMLFGMADAVAEKGYANVSVADVIKRAGVSRETFYQQFDNKQDCFLAAYEQTVSVIQENLREVLPPPPGVTEDGPLDRLDRFVECYLNGLANEPTLARTFLIEIHAAGPEAVRRRTKVWAAAIEAVAELVDAEGERQRLACAAIFYAIVGLATQRVGEGRIDELPAERESFMDFARTALGAAGIGQGHSRGATTH